MRHRPRAGVVLAAALATVASTFVVPIATASAQSPAVNQLLVSAAKTESAAYLQYYAYATAAARHGDTARANAWRTVATVEHQDHYTHEVTLANLYSGSDNIANLNKAIAEAQQTATQLRTEAAMTPGSAAATVLETVAKRETNDADLLRQALLAEQGHGSIPNAPKINAVRVQVSTQPKYSGTFYNALTSGSDSALEVSAWNWAEYQWMAKTAVDTGQAKLAKLFSGLEAQESQQNWVDVSNAAGYVNGDALNLEASIDSEQGAIDMYTQYASRARTDGNSSVAGVFTSIKGDEMGHRATFTAELHQLTTTHP